VLSQPATVFSAADPIKHCASESISRNLGSKKTMFSLARYRRILVDCWHRSNHSFLRRPAKKRTNVIASQFSSFHLFSLLNSGASVKSTHIVQHVRTIQNVVKFKTLAGLRFTLRSLGSLLSTDVRLWTNQFEKPGPYYHGRFVETCSSHTPCGNSIGRAGVAGTFADHHVQFLWFIPVKHGMIVWASISQPLEVIELQLPLETAEGAHIEVLGQNLRHKCIIVMNHEGAAISHESNYAA
jgi:hypothetical protein